MTAKFKIKTTFTLENKNYFVIAGELLAGEISKGMFIKTDAGRFLIKSIEITDKKNETLISLLIDKENAVKEHLFSNGKVLEIIDQ